MPNTTHKSKMVHTRPRRSAEWMGKFDKHSGTYPIIDRANIDASLAMLEASRAANGKFGTGL